jgi:hypothetical protein
MRHNNWMIVNNEIEGMQEEVYVPEFKELSWILPEVCSESQKDLSQDILCPWRGSKIMYLECKSEEIPFA